MARYTDVHGRAIREHEALDLPVGREFSIAWSEGQIVKCLRLDSDTWSVAHDRDGGHYYYGNVVREDYMFRAANIPQFKAQETFSAAAAKYL
ncbi:hypothetical protein [Microbacterium sp. APC 3901]|uniref:hypothetical protein n=1 Tax=Microbacterium sp. APC 3901 TaxID=3035192 RepID=UPI0025B5E1A7|nr:hypothetical protein [Microbacterium sp. APC 3901]MDN3443393.1 hypothetical protein [Microbacterium sp. APC 3901]